VEELREMANTSGINWEGINLEWTEENSIRELEEEDR